MSALHKKKLQIGLFGFGCVGQGLWDVLNTTNGVEASIKRICVKDKNKKRDFTHGLTPEVFTYNADDILFDPTIDIVVELIDDSKAALEFVSTALRQGKSVVTANKKMIAENFTLIRDLHKQYKTTLLYEAAVCGSIPVIRLLEEYYDNDLLTHIRGILNGTCNYILSTMTQNNKSYQTALQEAQQSGFAESNPLLDVSGRDTSNKASILSAHAFGTSVKPTEILTKGIQSISENDIAYATSKNCVIKLIASLRKVNGDLHISVLPTLVPFDSNLATANQEFNAIEILGAFSDTQFLLGRGAGALPTASAVLSDVSALTYSYSYEYKKQHQGDIPKLNSSELLTVYLRLQKPLQPELLEQIISIEDVSDQANAYEIVVHSHVLKRIIEEYPNASVLDISNVHPSPKQQFTLTEEALLV